LVRAPDPTQGYLYRLSCDGRYSFRKWDRKHFTTLVDWTTSPAILKGAGQANRTGVLANGDTYTLYANGLKLGTASDTTYTEGIFGLWVASYQTANFVVRVDEVDYWNMH
jgi:hypothetical protein